MNTGSKKMNGLFVTVGEAQPGFPHLLFVHGGPGGHSAYFEEALNSLPELKSGFGWVTFDQRGCGRSEGGELSHARNIADTIALAKHLRADGIDIQGVVGHSYGALLAFDCVKSEPDEFKRLVMIGLGPDMREPRTRSLLIDLIALKTRQPEDYRKFYPTLRDFKETPWKIAKEVRDLLHSVESRKTFYWGNLDAMNWYDELKCRLPVKESDAVYRIVRATLYSDELAVTGPHLDQISVPVLWINGVHDFLMSGLSAENPHVRNELFMGSGHYPHFEEPERFAQLLNAFIPRKA